MLDRRMIRAGVVALAMLGAGAAMPAQADTQYDRCMDKATTNADFSECGSAALKRADARLNGMWKAVYPKLPTASKKALLTEQRTWIAYKEKSCLWYANGDWGREGQVLHFPNCRADVIDQRTHELQAIGKFAAPK